MLRDTIDAIDENYPMIRRLEQARLERRGCGASLGSVPGRPDPEDSFFCICRDELQEVPIR